MSREKGESNQVALLATGDEIIQGDILNSNSQQISLRLSEKNIPVGLHMATRDNLEDIENTILFLLKTHKGLIITGGLGPTTDDITRFALSKAVHLPLQFDEDTWNRICDRLKRFGYLTPPENNRQQALFPKGATLIHNPNGTASGCFIELNDQFIFMLPGPPSECLPMVDQVVLPTLEKAQFQLPCFREKWLLFSVSEGSIAEELEKITQAFPCTTGYRLAYPYLEFKLLSHDPHVLPNLIPLIENIIKPYWVNEGKHTASDEVVTQLIKTHKKIGICDLATGGTLESLLKKPSTYNQLIFKTDPADFPAGLPYVYLSGLDDFWQSKTAHSKISLTLILFDGQLVKKKESALLPFRDEKIKLYASEYTCLEMLRHLF